MRQSNILTREKDMSLLPASSTPFQPFNKWVDHLNTPEAGIMQFNDLDFKAVKDWVNLGIKRLEEIHNWRVEVEKINILIRRFLRIPPLPSQRTSSTETPSKHKVSIPKKYLTISPLAAQSKTIKKIEKLQKSPLTILLRFYSQMDFDERQGRIKKEKLQRREFYELYLDFSFLESQLIFEGLI